MSSTELPRQVIFTIEKEDWGRTLLADGSIAETRVILSDLVVEGTDILGLRADISHVVALRVLPNPELVSKVKDKSLPPETPVPLTPEAGYEKIEIGQVEKPTESTYRFENYLLTIKLQIQAVARNLSYRVPSGAPLYSLRWVLGTKITKVPESQ